MNHTISYTKIEKALQLAAAYAGIDTAEIRDLTLAPEGESLLRLDLCSDYMRYLVYVDLDREAVLGFDCEPLPFSEAAAPVIRMLDIPA